MGIISIMSARAQKTINQINNQFPNKEKIAIIISNKKHKSKLDLSLSRKLILCSGVNPLLKYFQKNQIPAHVYQWITADEFKKVITNKNIRIIYIFGHGRRDGLKFENGTFLKYGDLKDCPKKEFIAQYHCNANNHFLPTKNKSLAEFISEKGDVSNWLRHTVTTYLYLLLICTLKEAPHRIDKFMHIKKYNCKNIN